MGKYKISTTTTCDLNLEYFKKNDVVVSPSIVIIEGEVIYDDYKKITPHTLYNLMREGKNLTTSGNNEAIYEEHWKKTIEDGYKMIHLDLSSGLSGSHLGALKAAERINNEYGEKVVYILDSLLASSGQGFLVNELVNKKNEKLDIDEVYEYGLSIRDRINSWFTSTDLTYYYKGGRISKTSMIVGNTFRICPILHVDSKGKLVPKRKARGEANAIKALVDIMEDRADNGIDYNGSIFISHSDYYEKANYLRDLILERFKKAKEVNIYDVHSNIGVHTGPGTVALFYLGLEREQ